MMRTQATQLLLIYLKEPMAGQVKTRLARDIGETKACLYYEVLVKVLLEQLEGIKDTDVCICFTPDEAHESVPFWILPQLRGRVTKEAQGYLFEPEKNAPDIFMTFSPQGEGDLGQRLFRGFEQGFQRGYGKVMAIGSDCPDCGARWIQAAFGLLKNHKSAVIGPSFDGGYYLLALSELEPEVFKNITWSSALVFEETQDRLKQSGYELTVLPSLGDVDTHQDWQVLMEGALGGKLKKALKQKQKNYPFSI